MKLIFDKSVPARRGIKLPKSDVAKAQPLDAKLLRAKPAELPEVSELDAVRHFTRLSQLNFSVDTQFYPLGSCTMKYNPRLGEQIARLDGFQSLHPLLPQLRGGGLLTQGALAVLYDGHHDYGCAPSQAWAEALQGDRAGLIARHKSLQRRDSGLLGSFYPIQR
jgi:glycine dehydrogenase subunit 2